MLNYFCQGCLLRKICPEDHESKYTCHKSSEFCGMKNELQEKNCFVNSALQAIFSIKDFQKQALGLLSSSHEINSFTEKLLNIQKKVREAIKNKQENPVDITEIRQALRSFNKNSFEINEEADSMEAFHAILDLLHKDHSNQYEDNCECLAHNIFGLLTSETYFCKCGNETHFQEELFSQHIIAKNLFKVTDMKTKIDMTLGIYSENELVEKSNLFKLQPFSQLLIKGIKKRRKEKRCEKCSSKFDDVNFKLRRVPKVFTIQLVWPIQNPNREKILQLLKNISQSLDLNELQLTDVPTFHVLKGMIVRLANHYIYIVRSEKEGWVIINDGFSKIFYTGDYFYLPHFFLEFSAYPVGLFYEESSEIEPSQIGDNSIWLEYEKKLNINEIYSKLEIDYSEYEWICFYCYCPNTDKTSDTCFSCQSQRIFHLEDWNCELCGIQHNYDITICDYCRNRRFWKDEIPVFHQSRHPSSKLTRLKKESILECFLCDRRLSLGMTLTCINCNSKILGFRCECDILDSDVVCRFCYEKFTKCFNCSKNILKTDKICRNCGIFRENTQPCNFCFKLGSEMTCDDCVNNGKVFCALCKDEVHVAVTFICPICDSEIVEGYCCECDYDVDYKRFVCGNCRKKAMRCFCCEAGLILQGDSRCHLCKTKKLED